MRLLFLAAGAMALCGCVSPPADAKAASVKIVSSDETTYVMTVDAPRYTLIASSISWWPGWRVRSDGERIRPVEVNGAFLGFVVPPGTRRVQVDYAPASFYGGLAISLATVGALAAYCLRRRSFMIRARV